MVATCVKILCGQTRVTILCGVWTEMGAEVADHTVMVATSVKIVCVDGPLSSFCVDGPVSRFGAVGRCEDLMCTGVLQ